MSPLLAPGGGVAGPLLALLSATLWGAGDFSGGMGAKAAGLGAAGAIRVLVAAHLASLLVLLAVLAAVPGSFHASGASQGGAMAWALACGVVDLLALAAFYMALARGTMGVAAAVSGLLAAGIPAAVGMVLEGRPTALRLAGLVLAALAIWLIAAPTPAQGGSPVPRSVLGLALGGGVGFGLYFTGLKFANGLGVLLPMTLARVGSVAAGLVLLVRVRAKPVAEASSARQTREGSRFAGLTASGWMWAMGVAVLDTGANLLYIAATRAGRLDVAAVLTSLYPASTILLAATLLHERPGGRQFAGMALAAIAVVLVTI